MNKVVPSRVIQDLIHFPLVVFFAIRTNNLNHFSPPVKLNLCSGVRLVKATSGRRFSSEESLSYPPNKQLTLLFKHTNRISQNK